MDLAGLTANALMKIFGLAVVIMFISSTIHIVYGGPAGIGFWRSVLVAVALDGLAAIYTIPAARTSNSQQNVRVSNRRR